MKLPAFARKYLSKDALPRSRSLRITSGVLLVLGGMVGFLPILGFWMVPLGVSILAIDIPVVRKWARRAKVWGTRTWRKLSGKKSTAP